MRQVNGRVLALSVRAAMIAGAWIAFPLGLVSGCLLGASLSWFAGAVLSWQLQLSLTLGVTEQLLPFGSQTPLLEGLRSSWYLVIPAAGLILGIFSGMLGALIGGLVAASYNRSPLGIQVTVEVPEDS
jgi:hypothetical protein